MTFVLLHAHRHTHAHAHTRERERERERETERHERDRPHRIKSRHVSATPLGSNLSLTGNRITCTGLGHRTVHGGHWGVGAAIRVSGSPRAPQATDLHSNISIFNNTVDTVRMNEFE